MLLLIFSVLSWAVIFSKWAVFRRARSANRAFLRGDSDRVAGFAPMGCIAFPILGVIVSLVCLAIAKRAVELHHGQMRASNINPGLLVEIDIPAAQHKMQTPQPALALNS